MSNYIKILSIFFLFIFAVLGFSQNKLHNHKKADIQDSLKYKKQPFSQMLKSSELNQINHNLSLEEMYELYILNKNAEANSSALNKLEINKLSTSPYNSSYQLKDSLNYFNNNLSKELALNYKELNKYDLGKFGQYLGLSRQMLTLILAILSVKR